MITVDDAAPQHMRGCSSSLPTPVVEKGMVVGSKRLLLLANKVEILSVLLLILLLNEFMKRVLLHLSPLSSPVSSSFYRWAKPPKKTSILQRPPSGTPVWTAESIITA